MSSHTYSLLTYDEAAEELRVSLRQVKNLVNRGDLPAVTVGIGNRRIRRVDLERYVEELGRAIGVLPVSFPGAGRVRNRKVGSS